MPARGGIEEEVYPLGGPYVISDTGCLWPTLNHNVEIYAADTALYTVRSKKSFEPNGLQLIVNMAGNVSEWTDSSYDPKFLRVLYQTMNPNAGSASNARKVIRVGSWKVWPLLFTSEYKRL